MAFQSLGLVSRFLLLLQASGEYGGLSMVARQVSEPRPLLEVSALQGFGTLGVAQLRELADFCGADYTDLALAPMLTTLAKKVLPGCTEDMVVRCLQARSIAFETEESLEDLLQIEWVTDVLDKGCADEIMSECKTAAQIKRTHEDFKNDIRKYQACI